MNDERFDELLQDMRDEKPTRSQVDAAKGRVWERLQELRSAACDELSLELAAYSAGKLSASRRLLIDDHLSRCVSCRHALSELRGTAKVRDIRPVKPGRIPVWARLAAAASIVFAVLYIGQGAFDTALAPSGPRATVMTVSGTLYKPSGAPLIAGAEIYEGEFVRTAAGSRAVLQLRDGSEVEMNQRTELAVSAARSGDTIRLERGDVIVEAADQGRNRLRVVTRDSVAEVKGTVFAVSSATAGSLVSVVEGSVEVSRAGSEKLLYPGEQASTTPALEEVGMVQAISWSESSSEHYALLAEFSRIEEELAASSLSMRHQATLVDYMPRNATAYFAMPNVDGTIADAVSIIDRRSAGSPALRAWWNSDEGREMRQALEQLQEVTGLLGDEFVIMFSGSEEPIPMFVAEVRPGARQELLRIITEVIDGEGAPPVQVTEDLLMMSDSEAHLALLSAEAGAGASSEFAAEIRERYRRGIGWLGAVDVAAFNYAFSDDEASRLLGLSSMSYLFVEQRSGAAGDESEATLSFAGPREGIASWIAQPGAIGSAEYLSANVIAASAGSTRDPSEAFDQLMSVLGSELGDDINELRQQTGIDLRDDVAASLGTDFVIALEGFTLGKPAWIAALEVVNPGALDLAVRRMVEAIERENSATGMQIAFSEETVNGRQWRRISSADAGTPDIVWTYDRGYMLVSTDEASIMRAIGVRDSAGSLIRSSRFQQQYPGGGNLHNSGFMWLDVSRVGEIAASMGQEVAGMAAGADPILVVLTGEADSLRWATRSRLTSLIFDLLLASPA